MHGPIDNSLRAYRDGEFDHCDDCTEWINANGLTPPALFADLPDGKKLWVDNTEVLVCGPTDHWQSEQPTHKAALAIAREIVEAGGSNIDALLDSMGY